MQVAYCDIESFSPVPINHGTHAYAEQAEIMLWPYAIDDGAPKCWDITTGSRMPSDLEDALNDARVPLIFHNGGMFDRVVLLHAMGIDLPIERIHDTMVRAMAHSLPGSLDKLGDILQLDMRKDKRGKDLIQLFCKPRPKNMKLRRATSATHPKEWQEFIEYALADIPPMRELYRKLPRWNYQGAELELWHLDQRINMRGVAIDRELATAAIATSSIAQTSLARQAQELTDGAVQAATQRNAMLEYINTMFGVELPDLRGSTVEKFLETQADMPAELRELLLVRASASKTSTAKYKKILNYLSSDDRLRGILAFCGASRTGRWAGRGPQFQNLPRPAHKQKAIDCAVEHIKAGSLDLVEPDVMGLVSSAIRGCIVAPPGKKLCVADLSNIEGRVLAWLAGELWKLQAFRDYDNGIGHDLYALAYAKAFGVTPEAVMENKESGDGSMRQIGKVQELASGFGGNVGSFITFAAAYGMDLEEMAERAIANIPPKIQAEARDFMEWLYSKEPKTNPQHWIDKHGHSKDEAQRQANEYRSSTRYGLSEQAFIVCNSFVRLWREAHPAISSWWKQLEDAVRQAIQNPGQQFKARKVTMLRSGNWLRLMLPSGRSLCYPSPKVDDKGTISYMGVNQYTRKWERITTYGGKIAENLTQAAARDVLAANMPAIDGEGYEIVLSVHDELLTETPDTPAYSVARLVALMSTVPEWAPGLPLAADGFEAHRYKK